MSELGEIRRDIDKISRKIDALIDVLLGRPAKLKPIDLDDAAIAALFANAEPGEIVEMPEGARWPHGSCRTSEHDRGEAQPEPVTTELECTGIDQYAIEIDQAGRRVRYEAPSVDGVRALIRAHDRVET